MLPVGNYKTAAGSEMKISGTHGNISEVLFDWVEEQACYDCVPEAYNHSGFLIWHCSECDGGASLLVKVE